MRVLSAIMFADIEGYSALMQENEEQAVEQRNKFKNTLEENLTKYDGKIIQFYGDGALLTFSSGLKAIEYALKVQQEFQTEPKVPVRIGVHMGDIIIESDGIFGDSVNIASRIESIAVPGSILISDKIQDEISNQAHIETKTLGLQNFKNVEKEIEVFAITNDGVVNPDGINLEGKVSSRSYKIAVLPLNNFSEDSKLDSLADSLTEEIISYLTMIPDFKIASRTSTFAYKGKKESATIIGRELGVDLLVEGSIRKYMSQLRVTIQLIDVEHGFHITSRNYDMQRIVTLKAQDKLAYEIAKDIMDSLDMPDGGINFQPKKKKLSLGRLVKYFITALLTIAAVTFGIIYFTQDSNKGENTEKVLPDKDSIKNNVSHYIAVLYASKHIYSGYNVSLSENFTITGTEEKYDPFSSIYRDSSNKNKLEFGSILSDELINDDYLCYFTLRGQEDSILAKLNGTVDQESWEIKLSKIEYLETIPVTPERREANQKEKVDSIKNKKDSVNKKIDSSKTKLPKNKKTEPIKLF
ncbi:MAG TPA: adenylate/guanylate cyclase domain-containing protein [Ignavibacteria bacterium]|jgi:TolB-like protein